MKNSYVMILLLGILVIMILSLFSGLALLMLALLVSAIVLAIQTLIQILLIGDRSNTQLA